MPNLKKWEEIMKQKNKNKSFRDFLKEICSTHSLNFYKVNGLVSLFPDTGRVKKIVSCDEYEKIRDSFYDNGFTYDFTLDFFKNYQKLFKSLEIFNIYNSLSENCDYATTLGAKNCYLSFVVINSCENVFYSIEVKDNCRNIFNSMFVLDNSENIYFCTGIFKSYKIFYSKNVQNSNNIWFCSNLIGCQECILCDGLENKSFCIENIQLSREEYLAKKEAILKDKELYTKKYELISRKKERNYGSSNCYGKFIINSKDVEKGFFIYRLNKGKNVVFVGSENGNENIYSTYMGGSPYGKEYYGSMGIGGGENIFCSLNILGGNMYYSYKCENCSFCLGCIGLRNKQYCILNNQYEKEEWYELVDKIFAQMHDDGILGDFFPAYLNTFYFNDTLAGLMGDFTREEVEKEGYLWREGEIKVDIPEGVKIIEADKLIEYEGYDDGEWYINPEIMKMAIKDEKGNYYRIVKSEYDFLMKHGLPLPRIHWLDRIREGMNM